MGDYAELWRAQDGDWYAHVRSGGNHEVIAQLEGHRNKGDLLDVLSQHWPGVTVVEVEAA